MQLTLTNVHCLNPICVHVKDGSLPRVAKLSTLKELMRNGKRDVKLNG